MKRSGKKWGTKVGAHKRGRWREGEKGRQVVGSSLVEEVTLAATPLSEIDLPLLTNNLLESFVFLCQSLPAEKEGGAVLYLYPIDID